ncbi:hypothetical protein N7530_010680 [Penicillium desertorum]|uniref:Uncharacterized protein n=1 Tax=Penicillium desertorum TaxID=1303715 RepID=A0A9W9WHW1_9EURO|nr:hypothetical protein N7530_010680 [Penicillium desertorum]
MRGRYISRVDLQILDSLYYLNRTRLEYQSLIYRNILLGLDSVIKIEYIYQKTRFYYYRDYIEPIDSDAFGFLSALSMAKSINSLKEVPNSLYHKRVDPVYSVYFSLYKDILFL